MTDWMSLLIFVIAAVLLGLLTYVAEMYIAWQIIRWKGRVSGRWLAFLPQTVKQAIHEEAEGAIGCLDPRHHSHDWGLRVRWRRPHYFHHRDVDFVLCEVVLT